MNKRLLVAVDGSSASNAALLKAIELARESDSELRLVHVIDETSVPWDEQGMTCRERALSRLHRESDKILMDAQETARRAGRTTTLAQRVRDRWFQSSGELIAAEARNWGADRIVIGSRGYSPIRRALLGSVDSAVMRMASMPVIPVTISGGVRSQPSSTRQIGLAG